MAQDIRDIMKASSSQEPKLPKGHKARFEARLQANFSPNKTLQVSSPMQIWIKIAQISRNPQLAKILCHMYFNNAHLTSPQTFLVPL